MKCKKAEKLILKVIEGKEIKNRETLEKHIENCEKCRAFKETLEKLDVLLTELPSPEPSMFLLSRIKGNIKAEQIKKPAPLKRFVFATGYSLIIIFSAFLGNKLGSNLFYLTEEQNILVEASILDSEWEIPYTEEVLDEQ